jgi:hypothetical protein
MLAEILALCVLALIVRDFIIEFFFLDSPLYCLLLSSWYNMIQYFPPIFTLTMG